MCLISRSMRATDSPSVARRSGARGTIEAIRQDILFERFAVRTIVNYSEATAGRRSTGCSSV